MHAEGEEQDAKAEEKDAMRGELGAYKVFHLKLLVSRTNGRLLGESVCASSIANMWGVKRRQYTNVSASLMGSAQHTTQVDTAGNSLACPCTAVWGAD